MAKKQLKDFDDEIEARQYFKEPPFDKEKKVKYIKLKKTDEDEMCIILQEWILKTTNAKSISIDLHRLCIKYIRDLQKIPLSREYQNYEKEKL